MLFNGVSTEKGEVDFKTLRQTRESKGIIFGADTTHTRTRYYADVPTNLGIEGVKEAVYELSRMVISPTLPEERIDHEKKVICNEWGYRQGTITTYLEEQSYISGFRSNPDFGHRVLGEKDNVRQITRQNLVNFMMDHYTKPNTTISVVGPVDHDEIAGIIAANFSDMSENEKLKTTLATALEPIYKTTEIGYISHNFFQINFPWQGVSDIDTEPADFLARFLISKRLNNTVRDDRGTTYGLKVAVDSFREHGYLFISTDCEPNLVPELTKEIAFELNQIIHGVLAKTYRL